MVLQTYIWDRFWSWWFFSLSLSQYTQHKHGTQQIFMPSHETMREGWFFFPCSLPTELSASSDFIFFLIISIVPFFVCMCVCRLYMSHVLSSKASPIIWGFWDKKKLNLCIKLIYHEIWWLHSFSQYINNNQHTKLINDISFFNWDVSIFIIFVFNTYEYPFIIQTERKM